MDDYDEGQQGNNRKMLDRNPNPYFEYYVLVLQEEAQAWPWNLQPHRER